MSLFNDEDFFPTLYRRFTGTGVTLFEDESAFHLEVQVPGIKADDIHMSFEKGNLFIEAKASEDRTDVKYYYKAATSFSYVIPLPEGIDEAHLPEAVCKDGILKIAFSKSRSSKPRKITVKSG